MMGHVLILSEQDVRSLVSPLEAQAAVERAFQDLTNGISHMAPRMTIPIPDVRGNMRILPAVKLFPTSPSTTAARGYLGVKVYTGYVGPVFKDLSKDRFTVLLYDMADGTLLAIVAARWLGALRTGATAAVATKHMARPGASYVCVVGTGEQAETQALNLAALLTPKRLLATSRNAANREAFASRLRRAGCAVELTDDLEQAVRHSDVVCLATTSREPVIKADWVQAGSHINAIGANLANRREVDSNLIHASRVVVEYREQALQEAGDLVIPLRSGEITEAAIAAELGDVVTGAHPGRTSPEEITLFKSIGVAIEDIAVAGLVYEKAAALGAGTVVEM